jgi:hypothetical protein
MAHVAVANVRSLVKWLSAGTLYAVMLQGLVPDAALLVALLLGLALVAYLSTHTATTDRPEAAALGV